MTEFAELFGHISDPAIVIDEAAGRVHACNDAFATLALRSCAAVAGADLASILKFEDGEAVGRCKPPCSSTASTLCASASSGLTATGRSARPRSASSSSRKRPGRRRTRPKAW